MALKFYCSLVGSRVAAISGDVRWHVMHGGEILTNHLRKTFAHGALEDELKV